MGTDAYPKFLYSQHPNFFDGFLDMPAPSFAAMTKRPSEPHHPSEDNQRAERLRRVRELLDLPSQKAFADRLGISPQRWNNFERGAPLTIEIAQKLLRIIPGLTLDWIYNGDRRGLTMELDRRLHDETKSGGGRARG
jgi:DNA-binding transcriptional regulator YiaG